MRAHSESYSCPLCQEEHFKCQKLLLDHLYSCHAGQFIQRSLAQLSDVKTCKACKTIRKPSAACPRCTDNQAFGSQFISNATCSAGSTQREPAGARASPAAVERFSSVPVPALLAALPGESAAEASIAESSFPGTGDGFAALKGSSLAQPSATAVTGPSPTLDEVGRGRATAASGDVTPLTSPVAASVTCLGHSELPADRLSPLRAGSWSDLQRDNAPCLSTSTAAELPGAGPTSRCAGPQAPCAAEASPSEFTFDVPQPAGLPLPPSLTSAAECTPQATPLEGVELWRHGRGAARRRGAVVRQAAAPCAAAPPRYTVAPPRRRAVRRTRLFSSRR